MNKQNFMSHELSLPELTTRGMILGALITIVFTASNVYLGLKVGLTFSSSIPAAVISMALLRFFKDSNVLENNLVQTQASAAGTLSSVIFVLPGLLMLGYWQGFPFWETMLLCTTGGCLGVLFTIPLRRAMVVNSPLIYPEGRAAAEILKVGSHDGSTGSEAKKGSKGMFEIVMGSILAGLFNLGQSAGFLTGAASYWFTVGAGYSQLPMGFSLALLGAGYLIGIASGISIFIGTIIAWGILVPYFTSITPHDVGMDAGQIAGFATGIWAKKVRFIGAGVIGISAIYTLLSLSKPLLEGIKISIENMKMTKAERDSHRMDTDMTPKSVTLVFIAVLVGLIVTFYSFVSIVPGISTGVLWTLILVGVVVAILIGFFVAAACGYMAGLVGTSASPISGIGIIAIIISSLVVYGVGTATELFLGEGGLKFATALALFMTSVVVCIAAISNDNLQDLKTGQLVGATPWKQQVALLIGSVFGALAIAPVLNLLYEAYGFPGALPRPDMDPSQALAAPQATLMTTIAQGIFDSSLNWDYILMGIYIGIGFIIFNLLLKKFTKFTLPPLAIGMGIYLPPSLEIPLVLGAVFSYFVIKALKNRAEQRNGVDAEADVEQCNRRGVLFASGLIVGESMMGVIIAMIIVASVTNGGSADPLLITGEGFAPFVKPFTMLCYVAALAYYFYIIWSTKIDHDEIEMMKRLQAEEQDNFK